MSTPNIPAGYLAEGGLRVKYELAWNPTDSTATLIRSVYAGISGPCNEAEGIADRAAAEAFAFASGKIVSGDWTVGGSGEHWAPLTSFNS